MSKLDPTLGRGCYTKELKIALSNIGFKTGAVWYNIKPKNSIKAMKKQWKQIENDLKKGIPSIVCMHYSDSPNTTETF